MEQGKEPFLDQRVRRRGRAVKAHPGPAPDRILNTLVDELHAGAGDPFRGVVHLRDFDRQLAVEVRGHLVGDGDHQVVRMGEVVIEGAPGQAGRSGDVAHGYSLRALIGHHAHGGVDEAAAGAVPPLLGGRGAGFVVDLHDHTRAEP